MGGIRGKPHPSGDGAPVKAAGIDPGKADGATEADITPRGREEGGGGGGDEADMVTVAAGNVRREADADVTKRPTGYPETHTCENE